MIYLFLANGFEEVEALAPLDLLRRVGKEVTTVAVGSQDLVIGAHGIPVQADIPEELFRDPAPEAVILPGGMPGAKNLDNSKTVDAALRACRGANGLIAAICAAPMIPGKRGFLDGKRATCFPGFENDLRGAILSREKVVRDGNLITAAGMGVAVEFGLALVSYFCGEKQAKDLAHAIQMK